MTEPELPPKVAAAPFRPSADGLTSAYRRSRTIHHRRAIASGSAGTTLALLLLAQLVIPSGGDNKRDSLVAASPSPTTSTSGPPSTPAPQTPTASPSPASTTLSRTPGGSPGRSPAIAPSRAPAVRVSPGMAAAGTEVGPPHEETPYDATRGCNGTGPTAANGWCSYYDGVTTAKSGTSASIATVVCRLPGQATATLTFANGQQAEFDVGPKAYPSVWTWSKGRHFATSSKPVALGAGRCIRWFITWGVRDDHGTPLPPGSYSLDASPMENQQSRTYLNASNPVTFTVTS